MSLFVIDIPPLCVFKGTGQMCFLVNLFIRIRVERNRKSRCCRGTALVLQLTQPDAAPNDSQLLCGFSTEAD